MAVAVLPGVLLNPIDEIKAYHRGPTQMMCDFPRMDAPVRQEYPS